MGNLSPQCFLELLRYWDSTGEKRKVQRSLVKKWQGQELKAHTRSTPSSLDPGGGKCQGRQRTSAKKNVPSESHSAFPPEQLRVKK